MEIEQEAIQYAFKQYGNSCGAREERVISKQDFIAGANSNAVKIEKLKFTIGHLIDVGNTILKMHSCRFNILDNRIIELEQQLKELEK